MKAANQDAEMPPGFTEKRCNALRMKVIPALVDLQGIISQSERRLRFDSRCRLMP
jgi:hypothetical protein